MQDLRYLTVEELERLLVNLTAENQRLQYQSSTAALQTTIENDKLSRAVESEIMERTLLGRPNDGGCSN